MLVKEKRTPAHGQRGLQQLQPADPRYSPYGEALVPREEGKEHTGDRKIGDPKKASCRGCARWRNQNSGHGTDHNHRKTENQRPANNLPTPVPPRENRPLGITESDEHHGDQQEEVGSAQYSTTFFQSISQYCSETKRQRQPVCFSRSFPCSENGCSGSRRRYKPRDHSAVRAGQIAHGQRRQQWKADHDARRHDSETSE